MSVFCPDCEADLSLGPPSRARWVGPDGGLYCSMHFIHHFGHAEKLVKINGYQSPSEAKPAAPKNGRRKKQVEA